MLRDQKRKGKKNNEKKMINKKKKYKVYHKYGSGNKLFSLIFLFFFF